MKRNVHKLGIKMQPFEFGSLITLSFFEYVYFARVF